MKTVIIMVTLLGFFFFNSTALSAQNAYAISGTPEVMILGTSNVHDWEMKVETLSGGGVITWNTDGSFNITALLIKINCKAIKSTHGSIMDNKTYEALKAEKFPVITYKLIAPINNIKPLPDGTMVNTSGEIIIAGVTKTMNMQVKIVASANGQISFEGTKAIKMSDFGVSAPTAFMGAMKVGDMVQVKFNTSLAKMTGTTSQITN